MVRLFVGMCKLSKPLSPGSYKSLLASMRIVTCNSGSSQTLIMIRSDALALSLQACFPQSTYTHNAFHLRLHILR